MELRTFYKTIVLSDIHMGSEFSRTEEVTKFLKRVNCDRLILNGDIIDFWQLKKPGHGWKKEYTDFFKVLMKMMEKQGTEIIYVVGNHDDCLEHAAPLSFFNFRFVKDYVLRSGDKDYWVLHGDVFDLVTTNMKWLAHLGDIGYTLLLNINKLYNRYRTMRGRPYVSLSQKVKLGVKKAVNYISDFENELAAMAENKGMQGVICGHIHQSADRQIGSIHYLNSGDWVESLTALTEDIEGRWSIITYREEAVAEAARAERILTPAI